MGLANTARMRQLAPWLLLLAGAMVAVGAYLQALNYIFVSDDTVYITENSKLLGLHFSELWRLFVEPYNKYEFLPLRDLSYWFDITLFDLNPAAFRVHNIILYLLCLLLVYAVTLELWRYFRPADDAAGSSWAAAAVTALFTLHPAHVEAVVWISGRKDVLSGLLALLALWLAFKTKRESGLAPRYAIATLLALLAAMLSKATAVAVAPIIAMLWLMFWRDIPRRSRSQLLWPVASLLLAAGFAMIFTANSSVKGIFYFGFEVLIRLLAVFGWLLRLAATPETRHFYYPVLDDPYLPVMVAFGATVFAAAMFSIAVMLRKRPSLEGFSLVVFLLLCIPYMQLIPYVSLSLVSDRFLFLALWPIVLLLVCLAWRLNPGPRIAVLSIIALLWIFQAIERPRDWRSLEALIDADIRAYPGYYMPVEHKIIDVLLKRGLRQEAVATANTITDAGTRNILIELIQADYAVKEGVRATGNPQEAMTLLWKLEQDIKPPDQAKWNPAMRSFWGSIGSALIGEWEFLSKQFPDAAPVHYNAGLWLLKTHKYQEAVVHWRAAAESPQLPESARGTAFKNFGLALMGAGNAAAAEAPLRAALQQSPPDFRAYCALADVYKRTGRLEDAVRAESDCHRLAPNEDAAQ
ncbi:MAG: hypothetical protein HY016_11810 [Nitrosomonadales bacterium]|nr:hypothetical protein [Nitrosomonadales bacterium]